MIGSANIYEFGWLLKAKWKVMHIMISPASLCIVWWNDCWGIWKNNAICLSVSVKQYLSRYTGQYWCSQFYEGNFCCCYILGILDSSCLSVCLSVCPSVCPLTFRVRPVASTVLDGFFPYLVQMINSMRGCVACDNHWPWPISSRSFGLDLENRVRSVASTVLDGFFLYLAQMITIIRGCVACYFFFRIWKFEFLANF